MSLRDIFEKQTGLDSYDVCEEYYTKEYVEWLEKQVVNVPEANVQPQLAEVLTELLHEAMSLLMNYEQRCEMDWIEDYEELIAKYNEHFS